MRTCFWGRMICTLCESPVPGMGWLRMHIARTTCGAEGQRAPRAKRGWEMGLSGVANALGLARQLHYSTSTAAGLPAAAAETVCAPHQRKRTWLVLRTLPGK